MVKAIKYKHKSNTRILCFFLHKKGSRTYSSYSYPHQSATLINNTTSVFPHITALLNFSSFLHSSNKLQTTNYGWSTWILWVSFSSSNFSYFFSISHSTESIFVSIKFLNLWFFLMQFTESCYEIFTARVQKEIIAPRFWSARNLRIDWLLMKPWMMIIQLFLCTLIPWKSFSSFAAIQF